MIVKEMYCEHCKQKTLHECQSNELWRCVQCHHTQFEIIDVTEDDIDWNTPVRYLYRTGNLGYVTMEPFYNFLRLNELEELVEGKRVRIPMFKIKDGILLKVGRI